MAIGFPKSRLGGNNQNGAGGETRKSSKMHGFNKDRRSSGAGHKHKRDRGDVVKKERRDKFKSSSSSSFKRNKPKDMKKENIKSFMKSAAGSTESSKDNKPPTSKAAEAEPSKKQLKAIVASLKPVEEEKPKKKRILDISSIPQDEYFNTMFEYAADAMNLTKVDMGDKVKPNHFYQIEKNSNDPEESNTKDASQATDPYVRVMKRILKKPIEKKAEICSPLIVIVTFSAVRACEICKYIFLCIVYK